MVSTLSKAVMASLYQSVQEQKVSLPTNSSYDPTYPMWSFTPGKKYVMFIPKVEKAEEGMNIGTVFKDANGKEHFNADHPFIHRVKSTYHKDGKEMLFDRLVRCVNGIKNEELGYDGECPLCVAAVDCNKLIREEVEAAHPGEELQGREWGEAAAKFDKVRQISGLNSKDVNKSRYHYFPVGVVEVEGNMANVHVVGEPTMYFYQATNNIWEKWNEALTNVLGNDVALPGHFFFVSYKDGDKLQAGRDVSVMLMQNVEKSPEMAKMAKLFNGMTDGSTPDENGNPHPWTLDVMFEKVSACEFIPMDQLQDIANKALQKNTLERIRIGVVEGGEAEGIEAPKASGGLTAGVAQAPALDASDLVKMTDDVADAAENAVSESEDVDFS